MRQAVSYAFAILHIFALIVALAGTIRRDALIARTDTILAEVRLCFISGFRLLHCGAQCTLPHFAHSQRCAK